MGTGGSGSRVRIEKVMTCGGLFVGVLSVHCPDEELVSGVLVAVLEGSKEPINLLDLPLCLPIGIWMIAREETGSHTDPWPSVQGWRVGIFCNGALAHPVRGQ